MEETSLEPSKFYLSFNSSINISTTQALLGAITNIWAAHRHLEEIHLLLSTFGGGIKEAVTLFNILRSFPFKLYTYNMGTVESCGNIVFLAGSERYSLSNATFMFHGSYWSFPQNSQSTHSNIKETADYMAVSEKILLDIIRENTSLKPADINSLFSGQTVFDAIKAKELGITKQIIREIKIPTDAVFLQVLER